MVLAAYSFDESGNTVVDYSGNGNNFSIAGTASVRATAGHTNGGLTSDTTGAPAGAVLPDIGRTANRTIMLWERNIDNFLADHWPIIFNTPSLGSGAWGILRLSGNICIQARNAATFVRAQVTQPADDAWHHIAGTYDGATVRLWIDGVNVASAALTGPIRTDTNPPQLYGLPGSPQTYPIDDLRIYDEALDAAAIIMAMNTPVQAPDNGAFLDFL